MSRPMYSLSGGIDELARACEEAEQEGFNAALELGIVLDRNCFNTRGLGRGEEPGHEYIHGMKYDMDKYLHCGSRDFQSQQRWW